MAERILAVCLQKSGTHLLAEVMQHLGLRLCGAVRPNPKVAFSKIPFTSADEEELLTHAGALTRLQSSLLRLINRRCANAIAYDVWLDMFWSWRERMGVPMRSRYDQNILTRGRTAAERYAKLGFSATPGNMCWFFSSLPVSGIDGQFVDDWTSSGEPAIIFNIRDPRDMLVSFVDYLLRKTKYGPGTYREYLIYGEILAALGSYEEQILYAICDPLFPGKLAVRESLWLLKHPAVLTVRYEDLAGERAGGTREKQIAALEAIAAHVGRSIDIDAVIDQFYNTDSFTFYKGKTNRWKEVFTPEMRDEFEQFHSTELHALGYDR